ncbi:MAG: high-potential iron-sulfur protein [Gammaproteobacteria bacterium]
MSTKKNELSRRSVLKGLAAIPVIAAFGYHPGASAAMVSPDDPTAKALQYTEHSTEADKHCGNCNLYQGGAAATGPCPIFPGKEVAAAGWCKSWVAKT